MEFNSGDDEQIEALRGQLGAEQGAVGLVDEERRAVRHKALHNLPEALLDIDYTEGVGISGQVYALKRPSSCVTTVIRFISPLTMRGCARLRRRSAFRRPGNVVEGPALVETPYTTIVIPPGLIYSINQQELGILE